MENIPKPEGFGAETEGSAETQRDAIEKLSDLIGSLGFRESEEMARLGEELTEEWSLELLSEYHVVGEFLIDEAGAGDEGRIALILQTALLQVRAGRLESALDNFADAIEYADNIMNEELGDEVHAIRKMLGWKK